MISEKQPVNIEELESIINTLDFLSNSLNAWDTSYPVENKDITVLGIMLENTARDLKGLLPVKEDTSGYY